MSDSTEDRILLLNGMDCVVMIHHLYRYDEEHGHADADRTLNQMKRLLDFKVRVPVSAVESGLYCCNLLGEEQKYWHPEGLTFDEFVKKIAPGKKFNKRYNWFEGD